MDLLPDSRAKQVPAGVNRGVLGTWVPVYCANCGADGGLCPEENMSFLFYLCNACAATHGHIANLQMMPDEVFWLMVAEEQLATYGRYLTPAEFEQLEPSSSIVKLVEDKRKGVIFPRL